MAAIQLPALPSHELTSAEDDAKWFKSCLDLEEAEVNGLRPTVPKQWHPALIPIRRSIDTPIKKLRPDPHQTIFGWQYGPDTAGVEWNRGRSSPLRTSKETAQRGLAFVDAVFKAAEKRGMNVGISEGHFFIAVHGAQAQFAVREEFDKEMVTWLAGYPGTRPVEVPTGRLFLSIFKWNRFEQTKYRESEYSTLEDHALKVFRRLYENVLKVREDERSKLARERRSAEVQAEMRRIEAAREVAKREAAEVARLKAAELATEQQLVQEAENWRKARLLREYVAAAASRRGEEWRTWALGVAERLDPLNKADVLSVP